MMEFKLRNLALTVKPRKIKMEKVCLEEYCKAISETGFAVALALVGKKLTDNDLPVDQTSQR